MRCAAMTSNEHSVTGAADSLTVQYAYSPASLTGVITLEAMLVMLLPLPLSLRLCRFDGSETLLSGRSPVAGCLGKYSPMSYPSFTEARFGVRARLWTGLIRKASGLQVRR